MNAADAGLAIAFLKARPDDATRLLEQQSHDDVASFLSEAPPATALASLRLLNAAFAAQVLDHLPESVVHRLLVSLEPPRIASILRRCHADRRAALLDELPLRRRSAVLMLLHYDDDSVGAWMDTHIISLPGDPPLAEALTQIREHFRQADAQHIYITDREGRLRGQLPLIRCLTAPRSRTLASLTESCPPAIAGHTRLQSAITHPGWQRADTLPVINRNGLLVGALSHHTLRSALTQSVSNVEQSSPNGLWAPMIEAFGVSLSHLAGVTGVLGGLQVGNDTPEGKT